MFHSQHTLTAHPVQKHGSPGILQILGCIAALMLLSSTASAASAADVPMDLVTHNAVLIHAPSDQIWPYIVDPNKWKAGVKMVAMGDGLFKAVMPDDPDIAVFYIKNVELVPERRRTIRMLSTQNELLGFASWELTSQDSSTLVEYHVYTTSFMPAESVKSMTAEQLASTKAEYHQSNFQRFGAELETLKSLLEAVKD